MEILTEPITKQRLAELYMHPYIELVKAVVDVDRRLVAVGADMHAELEDLLLEHGSKPSALWGIQLYPHSCDGAFIEYEALMNIRPVQGNRTMGVDDAATREQIAEVVGQWISN